MEPITCAIIGGLIAFGHWYNAKTERELKERKEQEEAQRRASEEAQRRVREEQLAREAREDTKRLAQRMERYRKKDAKSPKVLGKSKSLPCKKNVRGAGLIKSQRTDGHEVDENVIGKIRPNARLSVNVKKILGRGNG